MSLVRPPDLDVAIAGVCALPLEVKHEVIVNLLAACAGDRADLLERIEVFVNIAGVFCEFNRVLQLEYDTTFKEKN